MWISTKIAIALAGAILLFALFLGFSRYTLDKVQEHERRLNSYYLLEREIANVLIGSRVYRDRLTDSEYVENALDLTRSAVSEIVEDADKVEMIFVSGMLERVDQYTTLFSRMVQSKRFLSKLDSDVRTEVINFGELNLKMHNELADLLGEAVDDEEYHTIRGLIFCECTSLGLV